MRTRKTYIAIDHLVANLDDAERQLSQIKGMVKQLPKGWHAPAIECGYDDNFCVLLEMFLPAVVDRVNLQNFLTAYKKSKGQH